MASSIVISAANQLGGLVVKEAKYLYEVSDKIDRLQRDLRWMHCFLEDADNRQHREKVVAMWVAEISDFAYEAEEVIERYVHKVSHPRQKGMWNSIKWLSCALGDARALHEVGSNIDDLRTRIEELISRLQLYGLKVSKDAESNLIYNLAMREQRQTYSHIVEDLVGLEEHTKKVVGQLVSNDGAKVVVICGMGGLGKTTLGRQVFQDAATRERFRNNRAWVCISKQFEPRVVFREIIARLTNVKDADERTRTSGLMDGQLPEKICGILEEQECLVVLDDLWSNNDWDALKPAFESITSSGSKILITTRNNGLMQHVGACGYSHNLNLLNDEDSWKLFKRVSFLQRASTGNKESQDDSTIEDATSEDDDMETKEKLGREMLKRCKGLPLAILTLGGILSNKKTAVEWGILQKNITSYLMGDQEHGNDSKGLFAMLELSYNDLPFYLKPCFMYLGNFPEDYEIRVDRLYHLWEAEGLVTSTTDDGDEIEQVSLDDIAESYLNELVKRCLVQVSMRRCYSNGRIKYCKLHDVMRDMCLKKCKQVNFVTMIKHGSPKQPSTKIASSMGVNRKLRRCALDLRGGRSGDVPLDPSPNDAPCMRSLLVFSHGQDSEPEMLFSVKMRSFFSLLRVLDLQYACIAMKPDTFEKLIHLRYLNLRKAKLVPSLLPNISDCQYLETLDLRWSNDSVVLTSNLLLKLERLRHLYLPTEIELEGSGKLILTDTQLQQMETMKNFSTEVFEIKDLWKMTSMRLFTLSFAPNGLSIEEVEILLTSPMISTKGLIEPLYLTVGADVVNQESSMLTIREYQADINGFSVRGRIAAANLEIFHNNLTNLWLCDSEIGHQGILVLKKLPRLKTLSLLMKTVEGSKMSFSSGGFLKLDHLCIMQQQDLEEWEIGEGALPNLQRLYFYNCRKLKMILDGLPKSVRVECENPCISGVEKYNICPHSASAAAATYLREVNSHPT